MPSKEDLARWEAAAEKSRKRYEQYQRTKAIREFPHSLEGWNGPGWCKWCHGQIIENGKVNKRRYWHPDCAHQFNLHKDTETQFRFLVDRDGKKCAKCGLDTGRWQRGMIKRITDRNIFSGMRDQDWAREYWPDPGPGNWMDKTPEERATGEHQMIYRTHDLQVDHRVPLWAVAHLPDVYRQPYFGPRNLWLLCSVCHKAKTKEEAGRRARLRKAGWPERTD